MSAGLWLFILVLTLVTIVLIAVVLMARRDEEPLHIDPTVFIGLTRLTAKRQTHSVRMEIDRNLRLARRDAAEHLRRL